MLSPEQQQRYARQILLPDVGDRGQMALLNARVLCVGAGGLGSPLCLYLAGAGVGTLGLVDYDKVEIHNLQRQILHSEDSVGQAKVQSASERLQDYNGDITIEPHRVRITPETVDELVSGYDVVVDGSDNFTTRYIVNDACVRHGKALVSGALFQYGGQVAVFDVAGHNTPCYQCLFPEPPAQDKQQHCDTIGILGSVAGTVGCMQATEVIKYIVGMTESSLLGKIWQFDGKTYRTHSITITRDKECSVCGDNGKYMTNDEDDRGVNRA